MNTSHKTVTVNSTSNMLLWPINKKRTFLSIQNQSALDIIINVGATPTTSDGFIIPPGDNWTPVNPPKGDIRITGTAAVAVFQKVFTMEEAL